MTKTTLLAFYTCLLALVYSTNIQAVLIDRGSGLIYDTDLDITWLADANYAMTSGYDDDGRMSWSAAVAWAQQLNYGGYSNWRLPTTIDPDPSCVERESIKGPYLYDCSGSEMGHLFYIDLEGVPDIPNNWATFGPDIALFTNLQRYNYWSSTETLIGDTFPSCTLNCAWDFDYKNGVQTGYPKNLTFYALAVHNGDIGQNPLITLSSLTISGPISVNESSSASYRARATWSNGSISTVTSSTTWSENSPYATINSNNGYLTTGLVDSDKSVTISASYTYGGITQSDTYFVTIKDVPIQINIALTGEGIVSSESMAYDCMNYCETIHELGDSVRFEAIADSGWVFDHWTGSSCSGSSSDICQITISSSTTLTAIFLIDTDNDGIANEIDNDDDNDGVDDDYDAFPLDNTESMDSDGDGIGNNSDAFPQDPTETSDMDGDGAGDNTDLFPADPDEWLDADMDGYGNNRDTDDDNDGIPDWVEVSYGLNTFAEDDALEDIDSDGFGNLAEYLSGTDMDNANSIPQLTFSINVNNPRTSFDTDNDSINNSLDIDDDNDGIEDNLDYFPIDSSEWYDSDNDHIGDNADAFPTDSSEWLDTDLDGVGNNEDIDDDNDGVIDTDDAYPLDPNRFSFNSGGSISAWILFILFVNFCLIKLCNKNSNPA